MAIRIITVFVLCSAVLSALLFIFLPPVTALATPEYAQRTGLDCKACHIDPVGGGPLTDTGKRFLDELKGRGEYRPLSPTQHILRLLTGYLHMMAAIMWFGTIMICPHSFEARIRLERPAKGRAQGRLDIHDYRAHHRDLSDYREDTVAEYVLHNPIRHSAGN